MQNRGFEINPYDPCIANKMVNGSQMTIRWHVDDLMMSHLKQEEIMQVDKRHLWRKFKGECWYHA